MKEVYPGARELRRMREVLIRCEAAIDYYKTPGIAESYSQYAEAQAALADEIVALLLSGNEESG